ncbi:MAG: hypothetical protein HON90_12105 [Halobacteriovoraceae bacterium]|jgi:flagellar motor switch protein FliG|nr:hypothetical protein [Halobacteriovoraceae bacterium]
MFNGGVKEAAKMLMGLDSMAQKKIIETIRKKDPAMAEKLEANLICMEDLQYLTATMLVGLLRDINLETFGLALRTIDQNITKKIMDMLSTGIKLDIEDGLKGKPRRVSEVEQAQTEILKIVRQKMDMGQIVINPDGDELV